mgnify:CR=1 FL=1
MSINNGTVINKGYDLAVTIVPLQHKDLRWSISATTSFNRNKIKDNEDGTKQFVITSKTDIDLRKKLFEVLPKEEITIFELKKTETSLEDAFIKLIDTEKEEEK